MVLVMVSTFYWRGPRIPPTWVVLSLTLVVLVVLVVVSLVNGMGLSNRVNDLEQEMAVSADDLGTVDSQVVDALLELRVLSYWLAYPTTEPLVLEPPNGIGNSQGVLRLAADGLSGILIVASMGQIYHRPMSIRSGWRGRDSNNCGWPNLKWIPSAPGNLFVFDDVPQSDKRQIVEFIGRIDEFIDIEFTDAPARANRYALIVDRYDVHIVLIEINQLAQLLGKIPRLAATNDVDVVYIINDAVG